MESEARPISERWELIDRIGSGAMGEVWRGRHRVLGHSVAVKMMKRDASRDQSLVARFLREARISAQLRHRNIARVEDFGTTAEGKSYLVMELLQGSSLEDLIERGVRLPRARVLNIARHVGAACDVAHAEGVVHRDLKPANCFLVRDEDGADLVKVLDFGVAKVSDGLLATRHAPGDFSILGTPVYMSPEQARGDEVIDGRSDLWSLGVMVYELLTGALPFDADSLPMLLLAIQSKDPVPPSAHDPTLPAAVDAWVRRALARDVSQRFRSGRELADALGIALAGALAAADELPRVGYAPTAEMVQRSLAPLPPDTAVPTQPMSAVQPMAATPPLYLSTPSPPPSVPAAHAPSPTPQRGARSRALLAVSVLLVVGAAVFGYALLTRGDAPAEVAAAAPGTSPRPQVPVTPVPVVHPNRAARPAPPARPQPQVAQPAPAAPPPVAPAARPIARPSVIQRPALQRDPSPPPSPMVIPSAPPPPPPQSAGAYNPEEP